MTTVAEMRESLSGILPSALERVVGRIRGENLSGVYSFVIYPSSGFRDIGVAFSTRESLAEALERGLGLNAELVEMLKEHPDLHLDDLAYTSSEVYYEVNACEWRFVSAFQDELSDVNQVIDQGYDSFRSEGFDSEDVNRFFESLLVEALRELKTKGVFSKPTFEDDVLLGVQFPDSSEPNLVERVSAAVNSPAWHEKIRRNSEEMES